MSHQLQAKSTTLESRTGHWLTDSIFDCAHEQGKSVQEVSLAVFENEKRAKNIALHNGRAIADLERYFLALGYEIELVKVQG